jgi:hypothetical protein
MTPFGTHGDVPAPTGIAGHNSWSLRACHLPVDHDPQLTTALQNASTS